MPLVDNDHYIMEENSNSNCAPTAPGPTDFIQKLFRLVNDPQSFPLASWSDNGDSFLISDPHDFAKLLLPKHFKHDNFQSFIRQLNKYGFSKVKRVTDDKIWEFKHESFGRNSVESLKDIRRKAAATRRVSVNTFKEKTKEKPNNLPSPSTTLNGNLTPTQTNSQNNLETIIKNMQERINQLEAKASNSKGKDEDEYGRLLKEVDNLNKGMMAQDELMQSIIQCIVSQEKALMLFVDNQWRQDFNPPMNNQNTAQMDMNTIQTQSEVQPPYFSANIQRLVNTYKQVSKANGQFLNDFTQAAQDYYAQSFNVQNLANQSIPISQVPQNYSAAFNNVNLMPVTSNSFNYNVPLPQPLPLPLPLPIKEETAELIKTPTNNLKAAMKRKAIAEKRAKVDNNTSTPTQSLAWTWIVPPNVLLVDDDPTCQAIYARSLQILGCSYDIAKDGAEAVTKMKSRKYDMVLMDIWMPEMDGLSATKLIREFDPATPIIAITGDYREEDRNFYLEQGINEVLGKPLRVKELGPIMQKHWLKFCINRDSASQQNQMGNNDMNVYNNTNNAEYSINESDINNLNSNLEDNVTFNNNSNMFSAQMTNNPYSTQDLIAQQQTYYQPNPN